MNPSKNELTIGSSSGATDLLRKRASFVQHSLPGLEPGRYQIQVHQSLLENAAGGTRDVSGGLPPLTRRFGVSGPRFSLAQNAIHSVYPPANGAGEFSNALPLVVLQGEKLPWLRSPYSPRNVPSPQVRCYHFAAQGQERVVDYDEDQAAWIAVLLVSPSDFGGDDPGRKIVQGTIQDLVPSSLTLAGIGGAAVPGNLPANGYSIFSYLMEPQYAAESNHPVDPGIGQASTDPVRYLDVPAPLFNAICPSLDDLKMMAHVRAVEMEHKPIAADQTVDQEARYAVLAGNRLPETKLDMKTAESPEPNVPAGANLALLISLENMESSLRGHAAANQYDTEVSTKPDGFVRVVVLYQWRFTSLQDTSFEFETLLKSLNGRAAGSGKFEAPVPDPFPRAPLPSIETGNDNGKAIVRDMLASGFLPLNHVSRLPIGSDNPAPIITVSWHRGPFIPYGAFVPALEFLSNDPSMPRPLFYSADQLLRFDPNVGMYDVSYALAWQLGQLLALADRNFSTALYRWKKQVAMEYRAALEQVALMRWYGHLMEPMAETAEARPREVGRALQTAVLHRLTRLFN